MAALAPALCSWAAKFPSCNSYSMGYIEPMREVLETHEFTRWFEGLRNIKARAIIQTRIDRLVLEGNPGLVEPVGEGVSEMKIDFGPGYRIYFIEHGEILVVLLAGGDKDTQARDIKAALTLNRELRKEP